VGQDGRSLLREAVIPAVLAVLATIELISLSVPRPLAAIAIEVVACALLVLRKRSTLTVCTAAGLVLVLLPYIGPELNEPAMPILIVALASFSLARYLPRHGGLLGIATIFVALAVTQRLTLSPPPGLSDAIFLVAILTPPYAFGWVMRRLDESHRAQTRLLLEQQESARRAAAAEERTRIARELHDVLAHSISAMVVQAEAASDLLPRAPDRAVAALREVTAVGRDALAETGRLLRLIRDSPEVGLCRLPELVDGFRRSGLKVDLVTDGTLDSLPSGVDLSGYRIAQEALTNALKYASDRAVRLKVSRSSTLLTIAATNRTDADQRESLGGLGLAGMRERVSAFGGSLSHGLGEDGLFALRATLPLVAESR
jgi:signal transduction histidine kinase